MGSATVVTSAVIVAAERRQPSQPARQTKSAAFRVLLLRVGEKKPQKCDSCQVKYNAVDVIRVSSSIEAAASNNARLGALTLLLISLQP